MNTVMCQKGDTLPLIHHLSLAAFFFSGGSFLMKEESTERRRSADRGLRAGAHWWSLWRLCGPRTAQGDDAGAGALIKQDCRTVMFNSRTEACRVISSLSVYNKRTGIT